MIKPNQEKVSLSAELEELRVQLEISIAEQTPLFAHKNMLLLLKLCEKAFNQGWDASKLDSILKDVHGDEPSGSMDSVSEYWAENDVYQMIEQTRKEK